MARKRIPGSGLTRGNIIYNSHWIIGMEMPKGETNGEADA